MARDSEDMQVPARSRHEEAMRVSEGVPDGGYAWSISFSIIPTEPLIGRLKDEVRHQDPDSTYSREQYTTSQDTRNSVRGHSWAVL